MKTSQLHIRLSPALHAWAKQQAARKQQNLSQYLCTLIENDRHVQTLVDVQRSNLPEVLDPLEILSRDP